MDEPNYCSQHAVPPGGKTGQALIKHSGGDYDTEWAAGGGGATKLSDLTDVNTSGAQVGGVYALRQPTAGHFELADLTTEVAGVALVLQMIGL